MFTIITPDPYEINKQKINRLIIVAYSKIVMKSDLFELKLVFYSYRSLSAESDASYLTTIF